MSLSTSCSDPQGEAAINCFPLLRQFCPFVLPDRRRVIVVRGDYSSEDKVAIDLDRAG